MDIQSTNETTTSEQKICILGSQSDNMDHF